MPEKDIIFKTKIKHKGVFNFSELYRILHDWLLDQNYDVNEKAYKELIVAGGARDIEVEWEATKKVSDYFKFEIKSKLRIFGMTNVEVEIDGEKQKMNKGQLELDVACAIMKDYELTWEKRPSLKFLRGLYDKYLIKDRSIQFENKIIAEMDEFVAQAKSFLALTGKK